MLLFLQGGGGTRKEDSVSPAVHVSSASKAALPLSVPYRKEDEEGRWAARHTPVIPELRGQRQEDQEFDTSR